MSAAGQNPPEAGPPRSQGCAAALSAGQLFFATGRFGEAVRCLRDAQAAAPEDAEVNLELGRALVAAGQEAAAIPHLRRASRSEGYAARAWFELGLAEEKRRRWARAAAAFRHTLRLETGWFEAHLSLGAILLRIGRVEAAMEEAGTALRLNPDAPAAHRLLAVLLSRQRRFAEAAAEFSAWARQAPQQAPALLATARAFFLAGERQAAEEACRSAVGRDGSLLRGHLLLARIALAENRLGQAQVHLRNAVASRPQAATLRAMLARVMMRRSRFEAASKTARAALDLDPGCHTASLVVAELHIVNGESEKAAAILRDLERQRPHWSEPRVLRGELRLGRSLQSQPRDPPPFERRQPSAEEGAEAEVGGDRRGSQENELAILSPGPGFAAAAMSAPAFDGHSGLLDTVFLLQALILRELRLRNRGTRLGFLLDYVRPSIVMALHYIVFAALKKKMPAKIPIELFIIGSFTTWFTCVHVIRATMGTRYGAKIVGGVTEIHFGVGKAIWEFLSMFSYCLFCIALLSLIGWREPFPNIPATVVNFAFAAALGLGFGLVLQALARVFPSTEMLQKSFLWILFITSGHYFSISGGHRGLAEFVWWNPLLHIAELQRNAFDPGYPTQLVTYWYPAVMAAGLLIAGLMANKWTRHLSHD